MTHTPGPWAYEPTSGAIYYDDGDVEPLVASTNLDSVSEEQGEADGRLIAAAPELLAAGQALYDAIGAWKKPEQGFMTPDMIAAGERWCAALRKVEG